MPNGSPVERLKVYINSSSPLIIMETVEEQQALEMVRMAASELQLPVFEWSVADGLRRCEAKSNKSLPPGYYSAQDVNSLLAPFENGSVATSPPIANTLEPAGVLAHLLTLTLPAVYILKDFHRHIEDAVVARRLREVAQEFSDKHCTLVSLPPLRSRFRPSSRPRRNTSTCPCLTVPA